MSSGLRGWRIKDILEIFVWHHVVPTVRPIFSRGSFFRVFAEISISGVLIFALSHCGRLGHVLF